VEGTVREVKRRVRVVASSYRAIDRSVTRWIVVTMVERRQYSILAYFGPENAPGDGADADDLGHIILCVTATASKGAGAEFSLKPENTGTMEQPK